MKKLKFAIIGLFALVFSSCATFNANNVQSFTPLIKAAASVSAGEALVHIADADKRKVAATYLWSIAQGARAVTGTVPTVADVQVSLASFSSNDPELANLIVSLASLYADYYKQFAINGNVQASALILESIAAGVETAAANYK